MTYACIHSFPWLDLQRSTLHVDMFHRCLENHRKRSYVDKLVNTGISDNYKLNNLYYLGTVICIEINSYYLDSRMCHLPGASKNVDLPIQESSRCILHIRF